MNWDSYHLKETQKLTGTESGSWPKLETLSPYQPMLEYKIIGHLELLNQTIRALELLFGNVLFLSDLRELGSHEELGMKPVWELILKIRDQNSGMVIETMNTLLSMSFVEALISPIYCDGSIDILSMWRSKDLPRPW